MADPILIFMRTASSPAFLLSGLLHHRWALPILAELHYQDGSKFISLVNRLGLSKDSLSRTLEALMAQGLVMRNVGYGHPLRPEYVLTPDGMLLGDPALRLMQKLDELDLADVALRKWSLPVLLALGDKGRFSDLLELLPGISNRALTLTLKDLEACGLVERIEEGYGVSDRGQVLRTMAKDLVAALL
jgi:DNA-binding HxlR family transcriptional regulator